jgi:hypothetical protein
VQCPHDWRWRQQQRQYLPKMTSEDEQVGQRLGPLPAC